MQQSGSAASERALAYYVRKVLRMAWNVATMSETGRRYFVKLHGIVWSWIYGLAPHSRLVISYGRFVHRRVCRRQVRVPSSEHTFFLRNEPHFDVLRDVVRAWPGSDAFRVACVGCSTGAELYGAEWVIDQVHPDAPIVATGVDISPNALASARAGRYPRANREFERLTAREIDGLIQSGLFAADGDYLAVRPSFVCHARWICLDARSPELRDRVGPCDFVFVNNMLCHLYDPEAEACMMNIGALVARGGYLFTYGVDLDVKTRVVTRLGLHPVLERLEDVYEADWKARLRWPFTYWGKEPLDHHRRDWPVRYGSVFQRQ